METGNGAKGGADSVREAAGVGVGAGAAGGRGGGGGGERGSKEVLPASKNATPSVEFGLPREEMDAVALGSNGVGGTASTSGSGGCGGNDDRGGEDNVSGTALASHAEVAVAGAVAAAGAAAVANVGEMDALLTAQEEESGVCVGEGGRAARRRARRNASKFPDSVIAKVGAGATEREYLFVFKSFNYVSREFDQFKGRRSSLQSA